MKKRVVKGMKDKPNVLLLWEADAKLKRHLSQKVGSRVNLVFMDNRSEKRKEELFGNADAVIGWRAEKDLLFSARKLKLFINPGTGIKHHIETFRELNKVRKVKLVNGHGHSYATAQHAVAMLLALTNRLVMHHNWMQSGIWRTSDDKDMFSASVLLKNRKIGLLGYGAINSKVHRFLSGFSNSFNICKRRLSPLAPRKQIDGSGNPVNLYSFDELHGFLKNSDVLMIAVPHTGMTENMIGARELRLLGKDSLLVNVARGKIVNEKALYNALEKNVIGGAAIDVWYNYSPAKDRKGREYPYSYKFHNLSNIIMSPHRAASPFGDLERWDEVIENLHRLADGKRSFINEVDLNSEY